MAIRRSALMACILVACTSPAFATPGPQTDAAATQTAEPRLRDLTWIKGPRTVRLFTVASLNVPDGYVFLNPEDTKIFNALSHNPSGATEYLLAPSDLRWMCFF